MDRTLRPLPFLACLAVLEAALLPPRVSLLRDRSLAGAVHSEDPTLDNGLPPRPTALSQRISLLYQMTQSGSDTVTAALQSLEPGR